MTARDDYPVFAVYARPGRINGQPHLTPTGHLFAQILDEVDRLRAENDGLRQLLHAQELAFDEDTIKAVNEIRRLEAEVAKGIRKRAPSSSPTTPPWTPWNGPRCRMCGILHDPAEACP